MSRSAHPQPLLPSPATANAQGSAVEYAVLFDLWLGTWGTALTALACATESRTLGINEAAAHRAAIAAERGVVTRHFAVLLTDEEIIGSQTR
jgi:hypothetical protein